jgi:Domain of unknown function (DUF4124)
MVNPAFKNALYASRRTALTQWGKLVTVQQVMTKVLALLIGLALAGTAQAQIKCWTGADGKRACGDLPPSGARLETPKGAPMPREPAPAATDTKKGTSASMPQDQENRRRQAEYQKAAIKAEQERPHNMQECERAREMLREMGGGGRSKRTDAVKARALADRNC